MLTSDGQTSARRAWRHDVLAHADPPARKGAFPWVHACTGVRGSTSRRLSLRRRGAGGRKTAEGAGGRVDGRLGADRRTGPTWRTFCTAENFSCCSAVRLVRMDCCSSAFTCTACPPQAGACLLGSINSIGAALQTDGERSDVRLPTAHRTRSARASR